MCEHLWLLLSVNMSLFPHSFHYSVALIRFNKAEHGLVFALAILKKHNMAANINYVPYWLISWSFRDIVWLFKCENIENMSIEVTEKSCFATFILFNVTTIRENQRNLHIYEAYTAVSVILLWKNTVSDSFSINPLVSAALIHKKHIL